VDANVPETLHHVMVRGIEGRRLFVDDADGDEFVRRLAVVVTATGLRVYAWALLPDHAHLLVRTGPVPLARVMRSLLTGYAGAFNRRRRGHHFHFRHNDRHTRHRETSVPLPHRSHCVRREIERINERGVGWPDAISVCHESPLQFERLVVLEVRRIPRDHCARGRSRRDSIILGSRARGQV
jgi:REP element-mobilizing transposase RayT